MKSAVRLPILMLGVTEQRYSCHGCGNCCRDFTVQLRDEDVKKIVEQQWEQRLGEAVITEFKGVRFLRQRADGACMFLMEGGKCRIHAEFGFEAKPIACQLFPFQLTPVEGGVAMGVNFACQSVLESKGAELRSHSRELERMAGAMDEVRPLARPGMLTDKLAAQPGELATAATTLDKWLRRQDVPFDVRLDGLAWMTSSLWRAKLENVRGARFRDLLDALTGALPEELEHVPIEGGATARQRAMLRQAVFARTEDPKLGQLERKARWRIVLGQLLRSRRFRKGKGELPIIVEAWEREASRQRVTFAEVEAVRGAAAGSADAFEVDDLMTRWVRATVLGGRAWGAGYYGWSMTAGLAGLVLNVAVVGWLARAHAALQGRDRLAIEDVRAALGRVDRAAGRAKWLGSPAERMRLAYLIMEDGLRRIARTYALVGSNG